MNTDEIININFYSRGIKYLVAGRSSKTEVLLMSHLADDGFNYVPRGFCMSYSFVNLGTSSTCLMILDEEGEKRKKNKKEAKRSKKIDGEINISRPTLFSSGSERKSLTTSNSSSFSTCVPPLMKVLIAAIGDNLFARGASDSETYK